MKIYKFTEEEFNKLINDIENSSQDGDWWYVNKIEQWVETLEYEKEDNAS